jgi:cation/acetate symporter
MIVNFVIAITVSKFTAPVPENIQEMIEDIRIPRGAGEASAH